MLSIILEKIETSSLFYRIPIGTRESNTANLSGVNFDVGAMYKAKLNSKLNVYSSIIMHSEHPSQNTRNIATVA
jgi:hypothetical protein